MRRLLQRFLQLEASSGIILFMMAVIAMIWANSPLAFVHQQFIDTFLFWINEGLMALFFLLVGLELKRSFVEGELASASQIALPAVAALGGMLIPACLYSLINHANPTLLKGWATPVATDIAFALGVLSLFGRLIPVQLKVFLLALAIFDDIGAIIIIAFFYSHGLSYLWLFQSAVLVLILYFFNLLTICTLIPYLLVGVGLWLCLLKSGIHPTIAGILIALFVPETEYKGQSPLHRLENTLHPIVAYFIMPLFALANAGFSWQDMSPHIFTSGIVLGIMFGLFIGKQIGVFGFAWLLIRSHFATLPRQTSWVQLYGTALLCGIGFTMSLFLGTLSFQNHDSIHLAEVRLGVLMGSFLSGLAGAMVLLTSLTRKEKMQ